MKPSTDWSAIRAAYIETRSPKTVEERFGVSINTVRTRCRREGWSRAAGRLLHNDLTVKPCQQIMTTSNTNDMAAGLRRILQTFTDEFDQLSEASPPQERDWDAIRAAYLESGSLKQAAESFGIPLDTVRSRCRREAWRKARTQASAKDFISASTWAAARAYYFAGNTPMQTAAVFGLKYDTVKKRIARESWSILRKTGLTSPRTPYAPDLLSVYFAGKISKGDWRHTIVPGLDTAWIGSCGEPALPGKIQPIRFKFGYAALEYVGPYFVGCDHGCFHGPGSHGAIDRWDHSSDVRAATFRLCLNQLSKAHVVFAHVESSDAQGTMFELGWAAGRIPIFLNFASETVARECWFAAHSAQQVSVDPVAIHALSRFMPAMHAVRSLDKSPS